jgi:hypothetical protein
MALSPAPTGTISSPIPRSQHGYRPFLVRLSAPTGSPLSVKQHSKLGKSPSHSIRDANCPAPSSARGPGFLLRFANWTPAPDLQTMLRKPVELPPAIARAFVRDMRAFFKAKDQLKQDEIAAGTGWMLENSTCRAARSCG